MGPLGSSTCRTSQVIMTRPRSGRGQCDAWTAFVRPTACRRRSAELRSAEFPTATLVQRWSACVPSAARTPAAAYASGEAGVPNARDALGWQVGAWQPYFRLLTGARRAIARRRPRCCGRASIASLLGYARAPIGPEGLSKWHWQGSALLRTAGVELPKAMQAGGCATTTATSSQWTRSPLGDH